eukprot:GILK01003663.1.p1 GENE.GILK01003663.1~~GILK01003663.1.p1  ORF type:complete len:384 (-),score=94.98 GILK01003663.1:141-1292(-)
MEESAAVSSTVSAAVGSSETPAVVKVEETQNKDGEIVDKPKRLSKKEKKEQKKNAARLYRRMHKRNNKRRKREEQAAARKAHILSLTSEQRDAMIAEEKRKAAELEEKLLKGFESGQRVAVNCCFESQMNSREVKSLAKQLVDCYALLKQLPDPFQMYVTSFQGQLKQACLGYGANKWKVHCEEKPIWELFDKSQLVYLSPDSPNLLTSLDKEKVYVIGGLVDRQVAKNTSIEQARELGVETARLPVHEVIPLPSMRVLNINTVFEILLRFQSSGNMLESMKAAVPQRKMKERGRQSLRKEERKKRKAEEQAAAEFAKRQKSASINDQKGTDNGNNGQAASAEQNVASSATAAETAMADMTSDDDSSNSDSSESEDSVDNMDA